ncbi:MAG: class I SAM-dependent methyltransferase [Proteobacteria bacterium]|nr:class I SAM-dependent methyltransferase [Pseudomonadota bacterium]
MTLNGIITCLLGCRAGTRPLSQNGNGSNYHRCEKCGLAFVSRPPASPALERLYLKDISSPTSYYAKTVEADRITFVKRLRLLAQFQPERCLLLDIGCSTGTLMNVAASMGWEVEGVEPNPHAAYIARQQGFIVHEGFFSSVLDRHLKGKYQCVVMSDVIEHVPNPRDALIKARQLLAPNGFLLLSTPNLESFWCKRFQLKPMEHLFLFNSKNLSQIVSGEAFEICHMEKTSRRRTLGQLTHSTTEVGRESLTLIRYLSRLRLDGALAWMMEHFFKDELVVIARKTRRL